MKKLGLVLGTALACLTVAGGAFAQDDSQTQAADSSFSRNRNTSVRERPHPGYEALGERIGGFVLYPRIDTSLTYDDNIFATATGEVSDTFLTIEPRLDLLSDWNRHALNLSARAAHSRYFDRSSENHTDYAANINGRLDVERTFNLTGAVGFERLSEPRTAIEAFQFVDKPIEFDNAHASVGFSKEFNRLRIGGSYNASHFIYEDARTPVTNILVFQGYRDRTESVATGQVDYAVSPDTFVYVRGAFNWRDYDLGPPGFIDRNSQGYDLSIGGDFDLTNLMRGHVALGYQRQTFDNKTLFRPVRGLSVAANVDYFPTQLTTINFHANRTFQDTGIPNSSGYSSNAAGVTVDHELYRNILLNGRLDYERAKHDGIDRTDDRYNLALGGTYLVNRGVGISATYSYFTQNSGGAQRGTDFNDQRLMATLTLQY